ncbi:uncharacterized protein PFLUO_LOCUS2216 [Penicillium psychrofluorescens]|uniref:uncharacterized protein n=1 Tax=Penicillium psychrofluorescens TaxID=3158075 RepID=UPI003CCD8FF9
MAHRLQVASGACYFVADIAGWYVFVFLMLASVEFPYQIPLGDLSHLIPPRKVDEKEE